MPRGALFTEIEDWCIVRTFTRYDNAEQRMEHIGEILELNHHDGDIRSYTSYNTRFRFIKNMRPSVFEDYRYTTNDANRWLEEHQESEYIISDSDADSDADSDTESDVGNVFSDDNGEVQLVPSPPPAPVVIDKKRKLCDMYDEELDEYEKEILDCIKRRREEIKKEEETLTECPLCLSEIDENCIISNCGHVFCVECYCKNVSRPLQRYSDTSHSCPSCRTAWDEPNKIQYVTNTKPTIAKLRGMGAKVSI